MVDSMDIFKSLNISIGTVIRIPKISIFVPNHLKTKKMCKHALTKLPSVRRYVPDRYKTQQMCDSLFMTPTKIKKFVIK